MCVRVCTCMCTLGFTVWSFSQDTHHSSPPQLQFLYTTLVVIHHSSINFDLHPFLHQPYFQYATRLSLPQQTSHLPHTPYLFSCACKRMDEVIYEAEFYSQMFLLSVIINNFIHFYNVPTITNILLSSSYFKIKFLICLSFFVSF